MAPFSAELLGEISADLGGIKTGMMEHDGANSIWASSCVFPERIGLVLVGGIPLKNMKVTWDDYSP